MSKVFYLVIVSFTAITLTKTFAKYKEITLQDESFRLKTELNQSQNTFRKFSSFENKFKYLKDKSAKLDRSVETNDKLYYLTHSDNFEEALFLIDYLGERFVDIKNLQVKRAELGVSDRIDPSEIVDIDFYLHRLDQNLSIVERDLQRLGTDRYEVSQR